MSHPTVGLDDVVHQRFRLGILSILSVGGREEFGSLRKALGLSAGNLSRHLGTLAGARLVSIEKGYRGNRPRTWVSITAAGKRAYRDEMIALRALVALEDAVLASAGKKPVASARALAEAARRHGLNMVDRGIR